MRSLLTRKPIRRASPLDELTLSALPQGFSGTTEWVQIADPHSPFKQTDNKRVRQPEY